jgi:lysophospholipase L1-like esterase
MKHLLIIASFLFGTVQTGFSQNLNVVFIGNSITYGAQLKDPSVEAPPVQACAYMQQHCSGKVEFCNCGVSGLTTLDFLPITETQFPKVEKAANELSKNKGTLLFSIALGTNDSAVQGPLGSPVLPIEYYVNMKSIIDELLSSYPKCKVILQHPIWYSPNTYNGCIYLVEGQKRLESYFPMLDKLVLHYSKAFPNRVFLGDIEAYNFFKNNYLTHLTPENGNAGIFYLHPNKDGAKILGEYWGKSILKVIK